ncbi:MAG: sensor histidine kinase, partial [Anaerolineae bacterium]|nr:sensor histidine kinase [Anaerolineae bacterium]
QSLASLEERRHLARELHDSVSQALYGIALGTRTARMLLDRDPTKLAEPLDYIMNLAEAGLTEMRALIFELRPEILESEGLVGALSKQAEALRVRHKLQVETNFGPEPAVPLPCKEAFYRIAQEATHNVVKHAKAERIILSLQNGEGLILEIDDDGQGFDPDQTFAGHLGLRSMRERIEKLGGSFELQSEPGRGTTVRICLPP